MTDTAADAAGSDGSSQPYSDSVRLLEAIRIPTGDSVPGRAGFQAARRGVGYTSAASLAGEVRVATATISSIEAGRWTSLGVARRIAAALSRPVTDLFEVSFLGVTVRSENLRKARAGSGVTQLDLAKLLGVSTGTISLLEQGHRAVLWRDKAQELAGALEREFTELFEELDLTPDPGAPISRYRRARDA